MNLMKHLECFIYNIIHKILLIYFETQMRIFDTFCYKVVYTTKRVIHLLIILKNLFKFSN